MHSLSDEESDDDFEDEEGGKSDNSPPKNMTGSSRRERKKRQINSSGNPILEKGSYRDPVCVSCLRSVLHGSSWGECIETGKKACKAVFPWRFILLFPSGRPS
ncbi:hypothetical protein LZ31DRAFT_548337 [Colletotrichum somersetense]|nr:hypothetical protein LZ31DRAFT_548337 [Colletotrichum somersetense]